ncbi:5-formyltetrahydrofolate cyclo-ligase [Fluviispira multicolorata]|uniref:5-formyltetrahydrofolate cyclo-ligase n=1 Tax=Fluviispira multicolorata TaxID=2654512 RepID=A0A833JFM7_9BACT|nr:5-formyltetrahydrofolate cyclo-ligase [Fluviispira multicolorata]KAB8031049.1 5-formyltetrahydrofolate cyclo-ligase [Fluviispira multicolorata]
MRNLSNILSSNQNVLDVSKKKIELRKILVEERKNLAEKSKPQDWGARQFFRTLDLLKLSIQDLKNKEHEKKIRVGCYFPIRKELDIACFASESWLFPAITEENKLAWFEYGDGKEDYIENKYGIKEKKSEHCLIYSEEMPPLLLFVPGLAASAEGFRLGYGGGYYDRFLAKFKNNVTSVLCLPSENFVFDLLPTDEWDQKVDLVVW